MNDRRGGRAGGALSGVMTVLVLLWWLRWIILAVLIITAMVVAYYWRHRQQHPSAGPHRGAPARWRPGAGNAADLFTRYLPDRELIPRWYGQVLAVLAAGFAVLRQLLRSIAYRG